MADKVDLIAIGNGVGFVLPPDLLARLGVANGDQVSLRQTEGGFVIEVDAIDRQLNAAEKIMQKRHELLK